MKKYVVAWAACAAVLAACLVTIQFLSDDALHMLATVAWSMVASALVFGLTAGYVLRNRRAVLRNVVVVALVVVGAVAGFSVSVYLLAPSLMFYPHFDEESYSEMQTRPEAEELTLDTSMGQLSGWLLHNAEDDAPLVIYFYGNGQNAAPLVQGFQDNGRLEVFEGYNVAVLDYPGYGMSEGAPSEASLKEFGLTVYDALAQRDDVDASHITAFGYSIGTGVATYVASERDVDALVLMAPYADGYDLYNSMADVFYGPLRALVAFRMESVEFARNVDASSLVMTSKDDEVVPYASSQRLAQALPNCTFTSFEGFGHNDYWASEEVRATTAEFLAENKGSVG